MTSLSGPVLDVIDMMIVLATVGGAGLVLTLVLGRHHLRRLISRNTGPTSTIWRP
jgi:hypothetical protein